ncbi:MerR family transcriptional regulator [Streptomyces sp. NA04227]|uniref:MerR family transcriptional regulator n=1 Tax=Streptomyces sp. NA04227 TaxID=2742136 RepID=UPI0015916EC8|nr:MerR family transcriptional regulator [Streptomyces sp. NA04227]QKW06316.1 MerR family transcriptional regulator [Streptomyces sp. NA04227]
MTADGTAAHGTAADGSGEERAAGANRQPEREGTCSPPLLTIGAFAKASRLSAKALRLYDELDLLRPAEVDPLTGYRRYTPDQLPKARLVVWLRRLGMPLARIREVTALDGRAAAEEVRAYWARVETETAARRDLAAFLVDQLARRGPEGPGTEGIGDTTMTTEHPDHTDDTDHTEHTHDTGTPRGPLSLRYAAATDAGLARPVNQDAAYAGSRILAVADGFGTAGAEASSAAVETLRGLDEVPITPGDVLNLLEDATVRAAEAVRGVAGGDESVGTTLTAMLWTGSQLGLVHIGDSRALLLRDGALSRITQDHTPVQTLLDEGRLTAQEAASHPQRSLLSRALTGGGPHHSPDLRLHEARPGDRYLLCSDGLYTVVPAEEIRTVLAGAASPDEAAAELVRLAREAGGPDNIGCAVADVHEE